MINKNFYRKTNDKKILHKVGKQWKVVSVALLLAIGGGAAITATHANAANVSNDTNNDQVNSEVATLNASAVANPPRQSAKSTAPSASSVAPKSVNSAIYYYNGANGSAASYFDKVDKDNMTVSANYNTVNSYVQSLNAEYQPQVSSFAAKSASAKSAENNDSTLAKSYSATAKDPNTANVINSLAAKNSMDPTVYVNAVQDNEQTYSNAVSGASADVNAANDLTSLVNSFEGTDWNAASLSASTADVVAASNLAGATAISNSVRARFNPTTSNAGSYLDVANKLAAGVKTLQAEGNPAGYNAQLGMLLNDNGFNSTQSSAAYSAVNAATSAAVKSANNYYNSLASANNINDLETYASGYNTFNSLVSNGTSALSSANPSNPNLMNGGSSEAEYMHAVSAAVAEQFASTLQSAASSLYGKYNPEYLSYNTIKSEASSANASANDKVVAATNMKDVADANQNLVNKFFGAVSRTGISNSSDAAANVIANYLNKHTNALTDFESDLGFYAPSAANDYSARKIVNAGSATDTYGGSSNGAYLPALVNEAGDNAQLVKAIFAAGGLSVSDNETEANLSNKISGVATALKNAENLLDGYNNEPNGPVSQLSGTSTNISGDFTGSSKGNRTFNSVTLTDKVSDLTNNGAAQNVLKDASLINDTKKKSGSLTKLVNEINPLIVKVSSIANDATEINGTDGQTNGINHDIKQTLSATPTNPSALINKAALLSDGVDIDALNAASGAISDVNSAASSAVSSASANNKNFSADSYANNLNDALSAATSSANSADNSAVNASANYSASNDEDVTLAHYFAGSYASDANSASGAALSAYSALNSFYVSAAGDQAFTNADKAYTDALVAASNDYKMGVANAQYVFNNNAHFLDALKGARLHSTPNYGAKGDKVVGSVKAGDRLTVYGVNVSRNNNVRGVVRYYVKDNANGVKGFFTGQVNYSKPAYLSATADHYNVEVKTLKPVNVYAEINGKKAIANIPAGKVLENADVVYDNDNEDAFGFTKVETASDDFLTANTDYVEIVTPNMNNNTPKSNASFNINLPSGQTMAPYYNNLSQN